MEKANGELGGNIPNLKIFVEDYTQLPPKALIEKGETGECPICKKIGVIENRDGKISYFHRLGYEFLPGEKFPAIRDETCSIKS
jgi:hypothetical protein